MNDERLIRELRALDRPVSPDPAFGGALLAVLEDEYARRGRWSLIPALPGWHLGRRTLRVLAVLALLLAAILSALAIGSLLRPDGTPTLHEPRYYHRALLLPDGRVLVFGGFGVWAGGPVVEEYRASAELWDPATGLFTPAGSWDPTHLLGSTTLLADGRVLIVGGRTLPQFDPLFSAELWDPVSATFRPAGSLTTELPVSQPILLPDGRVLVTGVRDTAVASRMSEIWDPATESFTPGPTFPTRVEHMVLVDGRVLLVGTEIPGPLDKGVEAWDPVTGSFSPVGELSDAHVGGSVTVLADGRLLLIGGYRMGPPGTGVVKAEVFDPASGTSSPAGQLIGAGEDLLGHTATLLLDGRVLVIGGSPEEEEAFALPAQVWDPASASFSLTGQLGEVRLGHSATLLDDGRVLIVGGRDWDLAGSTAPVSTWASAEIWDPRTGSFSPAAPGASSDPLAP